MAGRDEMSEQPSLTGQTVEDLRRARRDTVG